MRLKQKITTLFNNFYWRNLVAYIITMVVSCITLFSDLNFKLTKRDLVGLLYYTFLFVFVFIHNRVLLRKLLVRGKILPYILLLLPAFGVFVFMKKIFLLVFPDIRIQYLLEVYYFIITLSLGTAIFFTTRYLLERRKFYESAILKREMELQQLRSQLNPHFLFNALNNIYSYTLYNNKFGNELILKLSELMRFILDSAKFDSIPLSKEIGFIENYIAFENERLSNRCQINYSKNILFENREITPLILFPFIENAFKYGADTIQNTTVVIQLFDAKNELKLVVKNSIVKKTNPSTKTGLANAKRRLDLLYPDTHVLKIESSRDEYTVDLTLLYDKN